MTRVFMHIRDPGLRMVARTILSAAGYAVVENPENADVVVYDALADAEKHAGSAKALVLTPQETVARAVAAMRGGVYGYVLLPFVPGELELMVKRAVANPQAVVALEVAHESLAEAEAAHIMDTLRACKHNQAEAARRLGIGRNTLWRKIKKINANKLAKSPGKGEA